MSYDLNVYLSRHNMPTPTEWRTAVFIAGFSVDLHTEFDVETFTGFLPSPVSGEMSGFEYYARPVDAEEAQELMLEPGINFTVQFVIGSRPLELVSALATASVLASVSGGMLVDPQLGESYSHTNAIEWARTQIDLARV